jgi:hypothetical protein
VESKLSVASPFALRQARDSTFDLLTGWWLVVNVHKRNLPTGMHIFNDRMPLRNHHLYTKYVLQPQPAKGAVRIGLSGLGLRSSRPATRGAYETKRGPGVAVTPGSGFEVWSGVSWPPSPERVPDRAVVASPLSNLLFFRGRSSFSRSSNFLIPSSPISMPS